MTLSSLPARPLTKRELRAIGQAIEDTAPMVVDVDPDGSDIHAAVLVEDDQVTAVVYEVDGWRVLDRQERPHPPSAFEQQFRQWAESRSELTTLC